MEFLGSISKAEVSSTNLILNGQSAISPFVITANRVTPNFVPCGIPPLTVRERACGPEHSSPGKYYHCNITIRVI